MIHSGVGTAPRFSILRPLPLPMTVVFFLYIFVSFFEARDPSTPRPLSVMCRKTDRERIKRGRIIDNDDGVSLARTILATGEPPRERCDRPIPVRIDKRLSAPVANR